MKIGKHKISAVSILRILSQIIFFIFLPALFISTFAGIKQIYISIINQNFDFFKSLPQLIEVIAIIPLTVLAGRFFCGWMCAFGAMGDFIYLLSPKAIRKKFRTGEKADKTMKLIKYAVLVLLVIFVWTLGSKVFKISNPWDAFGMLLTVGKSFDLSYVMTYLTPAFIILIAIIIASFFFERFFCRYLCPLGAIFAITSKLRITSIKKNREKCGNCRICTNNCPMGIPLYQEDKIKSIECINCFECISSCPRKNVKFDVAGSDIRPLIAGTLAVGIMTGTYYAGHLNTDSSIIIPATTSPVTSTLPTATTSALPTAKPSATPVLSKYIDGTYTGSGMGYRGSNTTVSVVIKNGDISDISVNSTNDDREFFNLAYSTISESIISTQSTNVDTVSGATFSSDGIIEAVADALNSALR